MQGDLTTPYRHPEATGMTTDRRVSSPADRISPTYRAWVEVDLDAIRGNVEAIRRLLPPSTRFMSVVKADGYGHGSVAVARTALSAGASWLAVATLDEGIHLRRAGIEAPILLFGPAISKAEVEAVVEHRLQPTVSSLDQARRFSEAGLGTVRLHVKVDTGMSRLGVAWQEAQALLNAIKTMSNVTVASLYSHLAAADAPDRGATDQQCRRFAHLVDTLEAKGARRPLAHLANSAATLAIPQAHYDLVRIGLAQYGIYPSDRLRTSVSLQPALSVKARIIFIKTVAPGTGVSYGHTFRAERQSRLATVAIGYGDGVPRALSNRIDLLIKGRRARQVGTITMDQCLVDVTELPEANEGDTATLLGQDGMEIIRAGDWAERLGTIPYEILTALSGRLPRVFLLG